MKRAALALIIACICTACIADIAAGYLNYGALPNYGSRERLNAFQVRFTSVTAQGTAAGIRNGDIADLRLMNIRTRAQVESGGNGDAGSTIDVPLLRDGAVIHARYTFLKRPPIVLDLIDVLMRILLAAAGVFLIARGTARDSLYAGFFVTSLCMYEGFAVHYWGPPWVTVAYNIYADFILAAGTFGARFLFALELLPREVPRAVRVCANVSAAVLFTAFMICTTALRVGQLLGAALFEFRTYWIVQMMTVYTAVAIFGLAAAYARGRNAGAVRWVFAGLLLSTIGPTINWIAAIAGVPLPAQGALNVTYVILAIVLPYAVLARGLVPIDFVFSRALVYTAVLSIVVAVFVLAEQFIERAALGRVQSAFVELLVPLILGLSFKWIEAWAERIVERVLYRDKTRASAEIDALIEDFPHAHDVRAMTARVAIDVHRLMRSPFVCIYRESDSTYLPIAYAGHGEPFPVDTDDPVFLRLRSKHLPVESGYFKSALPRQGTVLPLVVFGNVTGALFAQHRESGERFDPDEIETLKRLAHELAIALLWIERDRDRVAAPRGITSAAH